MLRCIAIDDEELALELLEDNIKKLPYLQLVATYHSPLEAMKILKEESIDLVFLDIQMPGLTGLQFIQSAGASCMFILVTAYEKYALDGYNLNGVDYLVKPVELSRFIQACNKAWELHQLRLKQKATPQTAAQDYIFVNVDYSLVKLMLSDILWIEGLKDYIKIHLQQNPKPVITRLSMKSMEEQLPASGFLRIHKSFIVAKHHISAVRKNSVFIGQMELPVGDNYREALDAYVNRHTG